MPTDMGHIFVQYELGSRVRTALYDQDAHAFGELADGDSELVISDFTGGFVWNERDRCHRRGCERGPTRRTEIHPARITVTAVMAEHFVYGSPCAAAAFPSHPVPSQAKR